MKHIDQIIAEVEAEEQTRRDADLALDHELNRKMQWIFDQLNSPSIRSKFDHPHCDHLDNRVDIEVNRGGQFVCRLVKDNGKMKLQDWSGTGSATFDKPEDALRRIIELLVRHKRDCSRQEPRVASDHRPSLGPGDWMSS